MSKALRIDEKTFSILSRIRSKKERNALAFALISYAFTNKNPQDLDLNSQNLIIFDILKNNLILKNQGGRKKPFKKNDLKLNEKTEKIEKNEKKENVPHTPYKEIKIKTNVFTKSFPEDFLKFWSVYPKKRAGSRDKAYSAYCRVLKERRATSDELLASAEKYAVSTEVARGFAKGCAAWLNDDRFLITYDKPRDEFDDLADFVPYHGDER